MMRTLLPPNASALEHAAAEVFAQRANLPVRIGDLWRPHTCPAEQLPWLAWARSVDRWFPDWSHAQRRQAIAASYEVHRHKGTPAAVKAALGVLGHPVQLLEWYQTSPPGAPYTFSVEITPRLEQTGITPDAMWFERAINLVTAAKNTRSHLDTLRLVLATDKPAPVVLGACTLTAQTITLYPPSPGDVDTLTPLHGAMTHITYQRIDLYPLMEAP